MVISKLSPAKSTVRKISGAWVAQCPCGYIWVTAHHRLALLFGLGHEHQRVA